MFQIGSFLESKTLTQFKKRTWFTVQNVQFIEVSTEWLIFTDILLHHKQNMYEEIASAIKKLSKHFS